MLGYSDINTRRKYFQIEVPNSSNSYADFNQSTRRHHQSKGGIQTQDSTDRVSPEIRRIEDDRLTPNNNSDQLQASNSLISPKHNSNSDALTGVLIQPKFSAVNIYDNFSIGTVEQLSRK
jgi:hypothetical protein